MYELALTSGGARNLLINNLTTLSTSPALSLLPSSIPSCSRMSRSLKQREIACARCFRLKRKCDHAKPTCGECRRKGAECLPARSRKTGDSITVPLAYLKSLEKRVAELEGAPGTSAASVQSCDVGVQTDSDPEDEGSRIHSPASAPWMAWETNKGGSPKWKMDLSDEENALVLFSETQRPGRTSRSPFRSSSADALSLWDEQNLDFLRLDTAPAYPLVSDNSMWLTEMYTNVYFSISHREWPFLNESAWKQWHSEQSLNGHGWQSFFLRMVYAIGASLCSTMNRDPLLLVRSKELYASAMSYYPHVVGHSSMVLQVQASLLLIVYALYSPSSEDVATSVSSILPFCTAAVSEIRKYAQTNPEDEMPIIPGEAWAENMFITCYMLNEIVASGWDRPASVAYRAIDDDVSDPQQLCLHGLLLTDHSIAMCPRRYYSASRPYQSGPSSPVPSTENSIKYKKIIREISLAVLRGKGDIQLVAQVGFGHLETRHTTIWSGGCPMWIFPSKLDDEVVRLQHLDPAAGKTEFP